MARQVGAAVTVDVEAAVITLLKLVVPAGTVIATEIPRVKGNVTFPERMVRVTRTTGTLLFSPAHDVPSILVECWADPGPAAFDLAATCRSALMGLWNTKHGNAWFSFHAETSGVTNYPDPRTSHLRYQFVHQLVVTA